MTALAASMVLLAGDEEQDDEVGEAALAPGWAPLFIGLGRCGRAFGAALDVVDRAELGVGGAMIVQVDADLVIGMRV